MLYEDLNYKKHPIYYVKHKILNLIKFYLQFYLFNKKDRKTGLFKILIDDKKVNALNRPSDSTTLFSSWLAPHLPPHILKHRARTHLASRH